jgi:tungstate transport system ATP-binding protein
VKLDLHASHILKTYDGNQVLKDCSFPFERPGIYVLTGPNGCGKSTFLLICALLDKPDKGEIIYSEGGAALPCDIALKRRMTLVLPKVGLFNTTVFKNVAYGLRIRGTKGKEAAERVDKALDFVGLGHKKDQNALTLSSGETQRAGIARALVIEPDILFLDEPTASVDEKSTRAIEGIIQRLKQDGSCTIVMTTHDHSQAARLADFLMVMRDGKISAS